MQKNSIMKKIFLLLSFLLAFNTIFSQVKYQGSVEIGADIGVGELRNYVYKIQTIHGIYIDDRIFIGPGIGYNYSNMIFESGSPRFENPVRRPAHLFPIFGRVKVNITKKDIRPFVMVDIGYNLTIDRMKFNKGFILSPAIGIDIDKLAKINLYAYLGYKLHNIDKKNGAIVNNPETGERIKFFHYIDFSVGFSF